MALWHNPAADFSHPGTLNTMSLLISDAHAQAAAVPPQQSSPAEHVDAAADAGGFYFLLIRPQQKRAKEHQTMLAKLAAGDEVVTAGGILGKVTEVGDSFLTVEIADGVRIKLQKSPDLSAGSQGHIQERLREPPCLSSPAGNTSSSRW